MRTFWYYYASEDVIIVKNTFVVFLP